MESRDGAGVQGIAAESEERVISTTLKIRFAFQAEFVHRADDNHQFTRFF